MGSTAKQFMGVGHVHLTCKQLVLCLFLGLPQTYFSVSCSPLHVNNVAMQNLDELDSNARLAHLGISCNNAVLHL